MIEIDFSKIPTNPSVYIYKDKYDNVIYVGKAKNLRNRIKSYFSKSKFLSSKTLVLIKNIASFDYIIANSEIEALLLENKLIKKYKPKYNILLRDSKTYPYIKISNEKIPKISISRRLNDFDFFFGPIPNRDLRNLLIKFLVSYYGLITDKMYSSKSSIYYEIGLAPAKDIESIDVESYKKKVDLAKRFLENKISINSLRKEIEKKMNFYASKKDFERAIEYRSYLELLSKIETIKEQIVDLNKKIDQNIVVYLENLEKNSSVIVLIEVNRGVILSKKEFKFNFADKSQVDEFIKMYYSDKYIPDEILLNIEFWEDESEKKLIEDYLSKFKGKKVYLKVPKKGDSLKLVKIGILNAKNLLNNKLLLDLKKNLGLKKIPRIIDCFDISNLSNQFVVGAVVRYIDLEEDKKAFRKFEIKGIENKQDDFFSIREVVYRRYRRILDGKDNIDLPDLIVIDGGFAHYRAALSVLKELGILSKVDLISIAKGSNRDRNDIFVKDENIPLVFDNNLPFMLYLRKIRDRVHNFVISYNRKKREISFRNEIEK